MKNKGFTLVEILAVIIILGALVLIIVPNIDNMLDSSKNKGYNLQIQLMEDALKNWSAENAFKIPNVNGQSKTITLGELKLEGFIDVDVRNPKTGECFANDIVLEVRMEKNNLIYEVDESTIGFYNADVCEVEY